MGRRYAATVTEAITAKKYNSSIGLYRPYVAYVYGLPICLNTQDIGVMPPGMKLVITNDRFLKPKKCCDIVKRI
jgi:hypothetical protein